MNLPEKQRREALYTGGTGLQSTILPQQAIQGIGAIYMFDAYLRITYQAKSQDDFLIFESYQAGFQIWLLKAVSGSS